MLWKCAGLAAAVMAAVSGARMVARCRLHSCSHGEAATSTPHPPQPPPQLGHDAGVAAGEVAPLARVAVEVEQLHGLGLGVPAVGILLLRGPGRGHPAAGPPGVAQDELVVPLPAAGSLLTGVLPLPHLMAALGPLSPSLSGSML